VGGGGGVKYKPSDPGAPQGSSLGQSRGKKKTGRERYFPSKIMLKKEGWGGEPDTRKTGRKGEKLQVGEGDERR